MGYIRLLVLIICFAGIVSSTSARRCVKRPVDKEASLRDFTIGNDYFSNRLIYEVNNSDDGSNVMSPISVLFILAQLALNTINESHTQLMNAMNLEYKEQIRVVFLALLEDFSYQSQVNFTLAIKLYVGTDLTSRFLYETKTYFKSEAESVDFSKSEEAAERINKWVKNRTQNLIPELVSPDMFSPLTQVVLVNAIYFKGNWSKPFKPSNTKDRNFYPDIIRRPIQVTTMYQQNTFPYGESEILEAQIIQLPYKGGKFSLFVFLPNTVGGLTTMLERMQNRACLTDALNSLTIKTVQLYLPKFKTNSTLDLTTILPKLGISGIFDKNNSGITGITKNKQPLHVSSAIQKAVIDVNEYGSQAAAATAVTIGVTSVFIDPSDTVVFDANHPFAYLLMYKNYTLFTGTFAN